jgi:RNA polymerase sigma-70 factor (ECF subfamily)
VKAAATGDGSTTFEPHRDRLFGIAYRMTGSVGDAEDCVQEAFLRWQRTDRAAVENDEAFLVRVVTRLAIDRQRQAARRRETYVGPWLPEPVVEAIDSPRRGPEDAAELADSLSFAFLVLLDRLSASERASFILHDVFGVPFDEVSNALDREPEACRQLASRARRKLRESGDDAPGSDEHPVTARPGTPAGDVISALVGALLGGDIEGCVGLLAPGVVLTSDSGPNRRAARRHVVGADRVLRLTTNLFARDASLVAGLRPVTVNGSLGLLIDHVDGPIVMTGDVDDHGQVCRIWIQMNPDKLNEALRG